MASSEKVNPDSDDEIDLEALRLAALQTLHAKPKFPRINHSNLIPIVPVNVVAPIIVHPTIKLEPISPTREENIQVNTRLESPTKDEEERESLRTETDQENEEDILSMDDKEEEDSLERLMDQLEAELSGKAPIPSHRTVIAPKKTLKELKSHGKGKRHKKREVEVELVEVKIGKQQGPVISIRESASPQPADKNPKKRNSASPMRSGSTKRNSRSPRRSRSRSPFRRSRSYKRSKSPYWSKSPRRSRSAKRSRSPFWMSRRSKSPLRKSRSPYRRSKSPFGRRRSPWRSSRTRSRSYDRRSRSSWSYSPRRRSRSRHIRDSYSPLPRKRIVSPDSKSRKRNSISPRGKSRSPRWRSRSPRRYVSGRRNSPSRRSKSPLRRSRSPFRNKSPYRRMKSPFKRSTSPVLRRTNSPINSTDLTPQKRRSPGKPMSRRSKSLGRRSLSPGRRLQSPMKSLRGSSKSPSKRNDVARRSPSRSKRSRSFSGSPRRRNVSPLRSIDKNKMDEFEKTDTAGGRTEKKPRSLSKERRNENHGRLDRRPYRSRGFRRFSPSRGRKSAERLRKKSRSPKKKVCDEKSRTPEGAKNQLEDKGTSPVPLDPVLEARKRKFENLNEVDPTVDKRISLKSIKEPSENVPVDDDEDALNINIEGDLWEESEESENEHESRFKTSEAKIKTNRTVLSFRNLRNDDFKKINLNKPLINDTRREKYNNRLDRWPKGRRNDRTHRKRYRDEDISKNKNNRNDNRDGKSESSKNKKQEEELQDSKKVGRKVIVFSSPPKENLEFKDSEVSTTCNATHTGESQSGKIADGFDIVNGAKDKHEKNRETDDFDKLISDFEKELESDVCLPAKDSNQTMPNDNSEVKRLRISVKKDLFESQPNQILKKLLPSASRSSEVSSAKERGKRFDDSRRIPHEIELGEIRESEEKPNQPEDYNDVDFPMDEATRRGKSRAEDEDGQNDLRDILSRRRNERLTKVVTLQESMPARLVKSAFQGLGNKKTKRSVKEVQSTAELSSGGGLNVVGTERRRVLLLQRKKPDVPSFKITVPEVKPDTTIQQRLNRGEERKRNRLLHKQLDVKEVDQEEEECFEAVDKQPRRVRLKRNVTLSSQVQN